VVAVPTPSPAPEPGQLLSVTALPGDRPGHVLVEVTGEVDSSTAPLLQLCLDSQTDRDGLRELTVDLNQVSFLGAAGVAALARARQRCRERSVRLVLHSAGRRRVFGPRQLTELSDLVGVAPVEASGPRPGSRRTATRLPPTPWRAHRDTQ